MGRVGGDWQGGGAQTGAYTWCLEAACACFRKDVTASGVPAKEASPACRCECDSKPAYNLDLHSLRMQLAHLQAIHENVELYAEPHIALLHTAYLQIESSWAVIAKIDATAHPSL